MEDDEEMEDRGATKRNKVEELLTKQVEELKEELKREKEEGKKKQEDIEKLNKQLQEMTAKAANFEGQIKGLTLYKELFGRHNQ